MNQDPPTAEFAATESPTLSRRQTILAIGIMVGLVVVVQAFLNWRFAPPEPPPLPEWYQKLLVL